MTQTDDKITLVDIKFSMKACENLSNKKIENLSDTAREFFYFVKSFCDFLKVKNFLNIWMVEDPIQMPETVICGIFSFTFMKTCLILRLTEKYKTKKK